MLIPSENTNLWQENILWLMVLPTYVTNLETSLTARSTAGSFCCCVYSFSHGLVLYIGLTTLYPSPMDRIVQEKHLCLCRFTKLHYIHVA